MKLREFLIGTTLMSLALATAKANPLIAWSSELCPNCEEGRIEANAPGLNRATPVAPSPLINEDKVFGSAYYDTLSILSEINRCSNFFGGPSTSVEVFNSLTGKVTKHYLPLRISMRMSGEPTTMLNARSKLSYRLFNDVAINANGAFYRQRVGPSMPSVPGVGTFSPNSRQARVLILLHELGHLIKGADGKWLLPDDGGDERLSMVNSEKVEAVCGREIRSLPKPGTVELQTRKKTRETIDLASTAANTSPEN
jgi:hypothetical protein